MQAPFADPLSGIELTSRPLPLVGREGEMQLLCNLLDTVALDRAYGPRALILSGETGIGKTRLLAEMYQEAGTRGFHRLEGRAYEISRSFPYMPFIEALRPVIRGSSLKRLRSLVGLDTIADGRLPDDNDFDTTLSISLTGSPMIAALARLFPELPHILQLAITPEPLTPDQEKFRLFDAIATLLERIAAEYPVLLGIDNLQWADSASLELTMYLTVRLHNSPVALVGASRPVGLQERIEGIDNAGTTNANGVKAFGELVRQGLLLLLPLRPLDTQAAAQHLHALLPGKLPDGIAQVLLARAGGNPFFLEELVRMLSLNRQLVLRGGEWRATRAIDTELPGSIMLVTRQRLQELSPLCRELLQVAALFGQSFPLDALTRVLEDRKDIAPLSLIEEAVKAEVIALVPI